MTSLDKRVTIRPKGDGGGDLERLIDVSVAVESERLNDTHNSLL